jgi:hypothetical protein
MYTAFLINKRFLRGYSFVLNLGVLSGHLEDCEDAERQKTENN